jgi:hypothetical protein
MSDLFSLQTRTDAVTVKSFERLVSLSINGDHFAAGYRKTYNLDDGSEMGASSYTVDRSIEERGDTVAEFNGTKITLLDWIALGAQFSELWRDENVKVKQAADAEAARWDALTPEQKTAEIDAAKVRFAPAVEAQPVLLDPTPLG